MSTRTKKIESPKMTGEQIVQKKLDEVNALLRRVDVKKAIDNLLKGR